MIVNVIASISYFFKEKKMKALKFTLIVAMVLAGTAVAADQTTAQMAQAPQKTESPISPVKVMAGYTYMTDYIWHGINLTKQLGGNEGSGANVGNVGVGLDLADIGPEYQGTVWVTGQQVWFNKYDDTDAHLAQDRLGSCIQRILVLSSMATGRSNIATSISIA